MMNEVYIVGCKRGICGVFKQKANAIVEKWQRKKFDREKGVYIKKRRNIYQYILNDVSIPN